MNWFNRWFAKKCKQAWEDSQPEQNILSSGSVRINDGVEIEGIRFTMMPANGGYILQSRHYDRKRDDHAFSTHLIHDGEDIAEAVGRIVAMEIYRSS